MRGVADVICVSNNLMLRVSLAIYGNVEGPMFGSGSWEAPHKAQQEVKEKFHRGG